MTEDIIDINIETEIPKEEVKEEPKQEKREFKKLSDYRKEKKEIPKENRGNLDSWAEKSIPILDKYGYLDKFKSRENSGKKENKLINKIIISVLIAGFLIFAGFFIFFGFHGDLKGSFVDNSTCTNSCPQAPACSLTCPTQNVTIQMPNSMNLNLANVNITNYNQSCLTNCIFWGNQSA